MIKAQSATATMLRICQTLRDKIVSGMDSKERTSVSSQKCKFPRIRLSYVRMNVVPGFSPSNKLFGNCENILTQTNSIPRVALAGFSKAADVRSRAHVSV